jgi:hypothetical protein
MYTDKEIAMSFLSDMSRRKALNTVPNAFDNEYFDADGNGQWPEALYNYIPEVNLDYGRFHAVQTR